MTIETFDPNTQPAQTHTVTMTDAAIQHVQKLLANSQAQGVRLGVKKSGCSGFKYDIEFVNEESPEDTRFQITEDVALYVPTEFLAMVSGTEVDFTKEGLNSTIKFNNPNAKDLCGCGESFSV